VKDSLGIVFFGSGAFAIPTVERLSRLSAPEGPYRLLRVVTRPDQPAGRGRKLAPTPVRRRAAALGLEVEAPPSANDDAFLDALQAMHPDLFLVADYGEMLRRRFRAAPRLGAFNLHASLLPRHRGAAPVAYAILEGDAVTGVTLFRIEKELDSGPIIDSVVVSIDPRETAGELEERLAAAAAALVERSLPAFLSGAFTEAPQDPARATSAPRLAKTAGFLDWSRPAVELARRVRAMQPWPLAYGFLERRGSSKAERVSVLEAWEVEDSTGTPIAAASPGTIVSVSRSSVRVACGSDQLELRSMQRAGRAALSVEELLRGWKLHPGDRFLAVEPAAPGN
jgi:methionyl-tRNA formyltransferase